MIKRDPFLPIRVHLSDGMAYDIHDPMSAHVTKFELVIGINPDPSGLPQDSVYLDPHHVTRVETLTRPGFDRSSKRGDAA